MCGIIGYVGKGLRIIDLLEGLRRLEYRGYDSAGIAFINNGSIERYRRDGKIIDLIAVVPGLDRVIEVGIGHTRWATHGKPSSANAHPHFDCKNEVAVVHNGIIENHISLREELLSRGHTFTSDTDTEVIAHLIEEFLSQGLAPEEAFRRALERLKGSFAIAVIMRNAPHSVFIARRESPLIIGVSSDGLFVASDVPAFLPYTNKAIFLEDGQWAVLRAPSGASDEHLLGYIRIHDLQGNQITPQLNQIPWDISVAEKSGYKHFMLKEIFEQPLVIRETFEDRLAKDRVNLEVELPTDVNEVIYVACGTSYHAGLVASYWSWELAGVPAQAITASEFRYIDKSKVSLEDKLFIFISQSGETADTLTAARNLLQAHPETHIVGITNVMGSSLYREFPSILTRAGVEIGVAATKTFTSQLITLLLVNLRLALGRKSISLETYRALRKEILRLPAVADELLERYEGYNRIAVKYSKYEHFLYLGRHYLYPIAMEGALKLKEISYIHAEAYPAGEMKHGPIALIDHRVPSLLLMPWNHLTHKVFSNLREIKSRDGAVIVLADDLTLREMSELSEFVDDLLLIPHVPPVLQPVISVIPLQMFAYSIADYRGLDVDQPRNLAKSVTVE